ncbi:hypothetical protein OKW21_004199 [Catalinimonas alkaloidigena]|uniref:sialidase family protein n=1 Tax=Catalinimonas alkaloidigena TaxID=1075417 RepID=UPI00240524B4|nr:sialidase family protein [Catalinimonas alkaloidigena]MDF9798936.1 hypothetical protein [Catalinimonas alkaloidigena]
MNNRKAYDFSFYLLLLLIFTVSCDKKESPQEESHAILTTAPDSTDSVQMAKVERRFIAIDNVCAWPNLTTLKDGTIIASIFNQPSHARTIGEVECWASKDGVFWEKTGSPVSPDPMTNRMNLAAGLANNGDLIVIPSGWSLEPATRTEEYDHDYKLVSVLRPWVARSSDGGKSWKVDKDTFPASSGEQETSEFIPFGDILPAEDGSLRMLAYAGQTINEERINIVVMFRSDDDGVSWEQMSVISDGQGDTAFSGGHNETALFHLGDGEWIAAARRWRAGAATDLFRSTDDGKTWTLEGPLTQEKQHPAHLMRLDDGKLLITYGNRIAGSYGVAIKISEDEGKSWSDEIQIVNDLDTWDLGYPASVQRPDGKIVTAYYAAEASSHQRYHMATAIWELP